MKSMEFDVPDITVVNDLTIYYKGREDREGQINESIEEIKTSKEEFLHKLRYFKPKIHEINQQKEIFIHDEYPIETFKELISTLTTKKISLNERNYNSMKKLSYKYGYEELYQVVSTFSMKRPDMEEIVDKYSKENESDKIDENIEETISTHLDICLQNENLKKFPIDSLNRILNSPKRVLNNHHLLFKFVKDIIEKVTNKNNANDGKDMKDKVEEDNLQILINSLDYSKMTNEELKEIFDTSKIRNIFIFNGIEERMSRLLSENEAQAEIINKFKERFDELELKIEELMKNSELKNKEKIKTVIKQIEARNEEINKYSEELTKQRKLNEAQTSKIENLEEKLHQQIEIQKEEENQYQKQIETQELRIRNLEEKILKYEELSKIDCQIQMRVDSDQTIKGNIFITENIYGIDLKRSKYLLNTNNSNVLGNDSYEDCKSIENLKQEISFSKSPGTYYLHVLLVDKKGGEKEFLSESVTLKEILKYEFTGRVESVTLERGSYKFEVWGAEGGKRGNYSSTSGKGGYSYGTMKIEKRTKFYIHVGESPVNEKGGWNGGGAGKSEGVGGGGSTDISLYGEEGSDNWNNKSHLYSRIIVAGGGGGSGKVCYPEWYGGFGGGENGQSSGYGPTNNGGTQTRAGTNTEYSTGQGFGLGGTHTGLCSSGGGSGWYGGGASRNSGSYTGGSGGSGYVYNSSTASNYPSGCKLDETFYLTNSGTISGDKEIPNPRNSGASKEKGHSGHGYVKITPL